MNRDEALVGDVDSRIGQLGFLAISGELGVYRHNEPDLPAYTTAYLA